MSLDYLELLTIRSALVYTKKNNKALNFDELIKKMDAAIKELKEYSEVKE